MKLHWKVQGWHISCLYYTGKSGEFSSISLQKLPDCRQASWCCLRHSRHKSAPRPLQTLVFTLPSAQPVPFHLQLSATTSDNSVTPYSLTPSHCQPTLAPPTRTNSKGHGLQWSLLHARDGRHFIILFDLFPNRNTINDYKQSWHIFLSQTLNIVTPKEIWMSNLDIQNESLDHLEFELLTSPCPSQIIFAWCFLSFLW